MTTLSSTTVHRLQVQGFCDLDPAWLAEISPWLRWSPALCAIFAAIGTATASPPILLALAGIALLGALLPFHPFDLVYNYGIRFMVRKRRLPPNAAPRRFACGMASVWLAGTASLFWYEEMALAYILGILFVAVAVLVSTTDICIPSLTYQFFRQLSHTKEADP